MKIKQAEKFAMNVHKGQKDNYGVSYFEHPKRVAGLLKKWGQDEDVIVAGLLHDVVEDSEVSLKDIEKNFGKRVAFLVDGMSWIRNKKTMVKDWPGTYKKFVKYSKKDPALVLIKKADMYGNPNEKTPKKLPSATIKHIRKGAGGRIKAFWIPFFREMGFKDLASRIYNHIDKYYKKKEKIILYDYFSKEELKKIKEKLR